LAVPRPREGVCGGAKVFVSTLVIFVSALVMTHAMLRRLTSWRCIIIIIIIITASAQCLLLTERFLHFDRLRPKCVLYMVRLCNGMLYDVPVVEVFVVHPHEVFLEAVDLGLAADDPVVVHDHAVGALLCRRKDAVSLLEVVQTTHVPAPTAITSIARLLSVESYLREHSAI